MVQKLEEHYKAAFKNRNEVATLRTRPNEFLAGGREWRRYAIELDQLIVSNRSATVSEGSPWKHEQRNFRLIEEAFSKRTSVIERELDRLSNICPFVCDCMLTAPRHSQGAARSSTTSVAKADCQRTETSVKM